MQMDKLEALRQIKAITGRMIHDSPNTSKGIITTIDTMVKDVMLIAGLKIEIPPIAIGPGSLGNGYQHDESGKSLPITTDDLIDRIDTAEGAEALKQFIKLILHPLMDSSGIELRPKNTLTENDGLKKILDKIHTISMRDMFKERHYIQANEEIQKLSNEPSSFT